MHRKAGTLGIVCLVVIGMAVASMPLFAQRASAQAVTWARTYGGPGDEVYLGSGGDNAYSIEQTLDGGYVVAGTTTSFGTGAGTDEDNYWILKLDSLGAVQWEKTYGTGKDDYAKMIKQTSDQGYIVAGMTAWWDAWILKLDGGGNVAWQKTYGTGLKKNQAQVSAELANSIVQTSDGGYAFVGRTDYFQKQKYGDYSDLWIVRLNSNGNVIWQKTYSQGKEWGISIRQTSDGGFIVGGGNDGIFLMKLDSSGAVTWQKSYGGWAPLAGDHGPEVYQTSDGGYVVAGTIYAGDYDCWIFKVDSTGAMVWQERLDGGSTTDEGKSLSLTSDGGYIVAGSTYNGLTWDAFVVKLSGGGAIQWSKKYGGDRGEGVLGPSTVKQTADGGYVVAATTTSYGAGGTDIWVLKLDENGNIGGCTVPGCGVDVPATVVATSVTPAVIPPMTLRNLPVVVTNTAATVMNSAATVNTQCTG